MAVAIEINVAGIQRIADRLNSLGQMNMHKLGEQLGAIVESQTRRRLSEEKESPDGQAWEEWSPAYKKDRKPEHSLLVSTGDLQDDITSQRHGDLVVVGTNKVYAAHQQFGSDGYIDNNLPARPFLGISTKNELELLAEIDNFVDRELER